MHIFCWKHSLQELERLAGEDSQTTPKISPNPAPYKKSKVDGTPTSKGGTPTMAHEDPYASGPTPKKLFSDELNMMTQRSPDHDEDDIGFQRDLSNVTCSSIAQKTFFIEVFFDLTSLAPFSWVIRKVSWSQSWDTPPSCFNPSEAMDMMEDTHLTQDGGEAKGKSQVGDTGGAGLEGLLLHEALESLQAKVGELQLNLAASMKEKTSLAADLAETKTKISKLEVERDELKKALTTKPPEALSAVSKEAARQRLRRLCEKKADGSLQVNEDVHQMWASGGSTRDKILRIFIENGLDKVRVDKTNWSL